jgi:hypothetical protein
VGETEIDIGWGESEESESGKIERNAVQAEAEAWQQS